MRQRYVQGTISFEATRGVARVGRIMVLWTNLTDRLCPPSQPVHAVGPQAGISYRSASENRGMSDTLLVIEAGKTEGQYWKDLWRFRELFYFLAWRDILVRYKQTAIGVAWSLLRPLLTMLVFTFI